MLMLLLALLMLLLVLLLVLLLLLPGQLPELAFRGCRSWLRLPERAKAVVLLLFLLCPLLLWGDCATNCSWWGR